MYSRRDKLPNYVEFAKNQKRIGRFSCSQKPYNEKIHFEPCFQLLKTNESGQIEKTQQVFDAENLGLDPVLEPYSDKNSSMEQEL